MGLGRFELPTSRLSGGRSNQLSYRPVSPSNPSFTSSGRSNRSGLQKLNSVRRRWDRRPRDSPIERVTGKTRDSSLSDPQRVATEVAARRDLGRLRPGCRVDHEDRPLLPRKEVIQPQVPLRLPCYDFTPITAQTLDGSLLAVGLPSSGSGSFRGVTGGVYKARERIHRGMLIRDY